MRIQTMNKKINQALLEMPRVEGEFSLKLCEFLKNEFYVDVTYHRVNVNGVRYLTDDEILSIENNFLLELDSYDVDFDKNGDIKNVWYYFNHKKTP